MADNIPDGLTRQHLVQAIREYDAGAPHGFAQSTTYDVLYKGRRYPPKAIVGLAAAQLIGRPLTPYDFKAGLSSKCFRLLRGNGFEIVTKGHLDLFPDELHEEVEGYLEGAAHLVTVNKYERDPRARAQCIKHYGVRCQVCGLDFAKTYGAIGEGFIHVHHVRPLSDVGSEYTVDPVEDLRPVCPNCHAMLHRRKPPYTIEELRETIRRDDGCAHR